MIEIVDSIRLHIRILVFPLLKIIIETWKFHDVLIDPNSKPTTYYYY